MSSGISYSHGTPQRSGIFNKGAHVDWWLLMATLAIVLVGLLTVHSTKMDSGPAFLVRQATAAAVGLGGLLFLMILPYQIFRTYIRPLYVFMLVILVGVLVFGVTLRGTRGWFRLGPIDLQSAEVAKILFVLTIAGYLDRRIEWFSPKSLVIPCALAMVPIGLILIQPDFSSSLVFFPMALVMFYAAGARTIHLLSICFVGALAAGIPLFSTYLDLLGPQLKEHAILMFLSKAVKGGWPSVWMFLGVCATLIVIWWFFRQMRFYIPSVYLWVTLTLMLIGVLGAIAGDRAIKTYQRKRLIAFVNPDLDPLGGGYNVRQSQIAIGSGRIFGKGYGQGTQSRLGFLPSRHTDFIFSVIGEEMGFFRALVVLGFYFLIIWRSFEISLSARDRFGGLVAAGFGAMFSFYALLNLGMTMGMAPVAGVPLPLVSYGGSSVVSTMFCVGILMSIHWRRYML